MKIEKEKLLKKLEEATGYDMVWDDSWSDGFDAGIRLAIEYTKFQEEAISEQDKMERLEKNLLENIHGCNYNIANLESMTFKFFKVREALHYWKSYKEGLERALYFVRILKQR